MRPEEICPPRTEGLVELAAGVARGRAIGPALTGAKTTGTRWHQSQSVVTSAINGELWTCSADHRRPAVGGRRSPLEQAQYAITTSDEAVEASAKQVGGVRTGYGVQALNPVQPS